MFSGRPIDEGAAERILSHAVAFGWTLYQRSRRAEIQCTMSRLRDKAPELDGVPYSAWQAEGFVLHGRAAMSGDPSSGGSGVGRGGAAARRCRNRLDAHPSMGSGPLLWNLQQALSGWGCAAVQVAKPVAATWPVTGATSQVIVEAVLPPDFGERRWSELFQVRSWPCGVAERAAHAHRCKELHPFAVHGLQVRGWTKSHAPMCWHYLLYSLFNSATISPGQFIPALRAQCRALWTRSTACRAPLLSH